MSKAHINTRTLGASLASRLISEAKHVPSQKWQKNNKKQNIYYIPFNFKIIYIFIFVDILFANNKNLNF